MALALVPSKIPGLGVRLRADVRIIARAAAVYKK